MISRRNACSAGKKARKLAKEGCPQTLYLQVVELAVLPRGRKLGCHRPSRVRSRLFAC
jgi:hypothetical protein